MGQYTLAAIDDTIDRGGRADWRALRLVAGSRDPRHLHGVAVEAIPVLANGKLDLAAVRATARKCAGVA